MRIMTIIPTYNEKGNIERLVREILSLPGRIEVIVVDDNSPDGTGDIADHISAEQPDRVHVIHRSGKLGLGSAHIAGINDALEMGATQIITMDGDFSHSPTYLPVLLQKSEEVDLVIGSRYVRGGMASGCALHRRLLSRGANIFAHLMLGLSARDATAGFRCYRREVLESIQLSCIQAEGYSFLIEMLFFCEKAGWKVSEVPILFMNRTVGSSKVSRDEIIKAIQTVLQLTKYRLRGSVPAMKLRPSRRPCGDVAPYLRSRA